MLPEIAVRRYRISEPNNIVYNSLITRLKGFFVDESFYGAEHHTDIQRIFHFRDSTIILDAKETRNENAQEREIFNILITMSGSLLSELKESILDRDFNEFTSELPKDALDKLVRIFDKSTMSDYPNSTRT